MKACFLKALSRLTGTIDAALILSLETFNRGADLVAHPEKTAGQSIFTWFAFIPMKMYSNIFPHLLDYKQREMCRQNLNQQNLIICLAKVKEKKCTRQPTLMFSVFDTIVSSQVFKAIFVFLQCLHNSSRPSKEHVLKLFSDFSFLTCKILHTCTGTIQKEEGSFLKLLLLLGLSMND